MSDGGGRRRRPTFRCMKRRLIILLTALTALALAPSADAFVAPVPRGAPFGLAADADGTFGPGGTTTVTIHGFSAVPFGTGGTVAMSSTDATGTHSYTASVDSVNTEPTSTSAGI